jgi:hypothetical protein
MTFPVCKGLMPSKRTYHAADILDKWMLIYGGFDIEDKSDFWALNLAKCQWNQFSITGPHPPRKFHTLSVIGSNAYIFGGCVLKYSNTKYIYE